MPHPLSLHVNTTVKDTVLALVPLSLSLLYGRDRGGCPDMSQFRQTVADFILAGNTLLEAKDLSDDEEDSVRDLLWQLSVKFPDEGDDAAD